MLFFSGYSRLCQNGSELSWGWIELTLPKVCGAIHSEFGSVWLSPLHPLKKVDPKRHLTDLVQYVDGGR